MQSQSYFTTEWIAACCLAAVGLANLSAKADTLWLVGDNSPKFGLVVARQDNGVLVFKLRGENETYTEQTFAKGDIETLVVNVDVRRLEALDPGNLKPYHDYAEELASQKLDPEARDLAIRLFLIAAAGANRQNDSDMVESALTGLPDLARNDTELEAFKRLLMLYARIPRSASTARMSEKQTPVTSADARAREQLLQAVRLIRRADNESAIQILNSRDVKEELGNWSDLASLADLRAMTDSSRLSRLQLRKLLALELALQDSESPRQPSTRPASWAEQAQEPMRGWTRLPNFNNVTEFDPAKSFFRNGRWIKPVVSNAD